MSIKTIVAAIALQNEDDLVAGRVIQLAKQHDARLIVVHVIEDATSDAPNVPKLIDRSAINQILEEEATDRLKKLFEATASSVEIIIKTGHTHKIIDGVIRQYDADLVVIGSGTPDNIYEKVFGSTADRVVRSSRCPILVAKGHSTEAWRQVVVAVDLSEAAKAAVEATARIAPTATTNLIHIVEIPMNFEQAMLKAGTSAKEIKRYRDAKAQFARKELLAVFSSDHDVPIRITHGSASRVLVQLATRGEVDLIALGAQGKNAMSRLMLGSITHKILKQASCDVLVAPARESVTDCV